MNFRHIGFVAMFAVAGCATSVGDIGMTADRDPVADAAVADGTSNGNVVVADATDESSDSNVVVTDSGTTEASTPILVVQQITTPAFAQEGQQDQAFRYLVLTANQAVEIHSEPFIFGPADGVDATRFRGSRGTDYFRDVRMVDQATGLTMMGPLDVQLPPASAFNGVFADGFIMQAGETRTFVFQMDVATEDAAGELVGRRYNFFLGSPENGHVFRDGDVLLLSSRTIVRDEEIQGNRDQAVSVTIAAPGWPNQNGCFPIDYPGAFSEGVHCTGGCYYFVSSGLPYETRLDSNRDRCMTVCSVSGTLLQPGRRDGSSDPCLP